MDYKVTSDERIPFDYELSFIVWDKLIKGCVLCFSMMYTVARCNDVLYIRTSCTQGWTAQTISAGQMLTL